MSDTPVPLYFEDSDVDDLSFSDLPLFAVDRPEGLLPSGPSRPPTSSLRDASEFEFEFEFSVGPAIDAFRFCGRSLPYDEPCECRGDSLLLHSDSFGHRDRANRSYASSRLLQSDSPIRVMRSSSSVAPAARARSSSSWRRHGALIGITKFPARMELSDIRKRQGRRAPAPLFPVAEGGKEVVASGRSGGHWSLLRPLRRRSRLGNALAKACMRCIAHA